MPFTPKDLTALEGITFTLPLCVINDSLNPDVRAVINWGDGSKEVVKQFSRKDNNIYTKLVNKKYTFPGTYNISIDVKRDVKDFFNDGFKTVGYYNMTVYPTTLSYAPSANFLVASLAPSNSAVFMFLDDNGVPHSFAGKTLRSVINWNNAFFNLTYNENIPGKVKIELPSQFIGSFPFSNVTYAIIEITNTTQLSSMILQGLIKRVDIFSNGLTVA